MKFYRILFLVFLCACSSQSKKTETLGSSQPNIKEAIVADDSGPQIDYVGLQRELGLEFAVTNLGYREKAFNTCQAGYGYSATKNCHKAYFAVLYFQLLCRDSMDTVSTIVTDDQMAPLSGRKLRWVLKDKQGILDLDNQGFGQILTVVSSPSSNQRVKLIVDQDFLYMRAGEMNRIVTPKNWCNRF